MPEDYIHGYAPEEQKRLAVLNTLLNDLCLSRLRLSHERSILDLGSGLGIFSRTIARTLPSAKVYGLEFDQIQLSAAHRLASESGEANLVDYREGSVYHLSSIFSEKFDLIFTRFLFEHLTDIPTALQECREVLAEGGRIVVLDDDHANFRIYPNVRQFVPLWKSMCQGYLDRGQDPYVGRRLVSYLHDAGFEQVELDFVRFGGTQNQPNFDLYAENLIGLFEGIRDELMQALGWDNTQFQDAISELRYWSVKPDAALWYALNWAEGRK